MSTRMAMAALAVCALLGTKSVLGAEPPRQSKSQDVFDQWDMNKDSKLDADELAKVLRGPNAKAEQHKRGKAGAEAEQAEQVLLQKYDADKDGFMSRSEFKAFEKAVAAEQKRIQERWRRLLHRSHHR